MDESDDDRLDELRELSSELLFDVSDETLVDVLDVTEDIKSTAESLYDPVEEPTSRGSDSDDEYNALLDVYPSVRFEADEGPLASETFAVKDNIAVENLAMTAGLAEFSYVTSYDASVVERLLSAGAGLRGKANMDALAFGPTGEFSERKPVRNPSVDDRVPGGSSSGSAAAVAGGLVDFALGSDTGGSIRVPAACCDVVGVKPSHQLVPRYGFMDLAPSLDTIGPLARDVQTAATVLETIVGHDPRDPTSSRVDLDPLDASLDDHCDLTFGLVESFLDVSSDPVTEHVRDLAADLETREDVSVTSVDVDFGEVEQSYFIFAAEFAWVIRQGGIIRGMGTEYTEALWNAMDRMRTDRVGSENTAWRVLPAAFLDTETRGRAYAAARAEIIEYQSRTRDAFESVDLLLTPTLRVLPPEFDSVVTSEGVLHIVGNTSPFNLTGAPAVSVPGGDVDGVPVGVQVAAPIFEDRRALQGARLIESMQSD